MNSLLKLNDRCMRTHYTILSILEQYFIFSTIKKFRHIISSSLKIMHTYKPFLLSHKQAIILQSCSNFSTLLCPPTQPQPPIPACLHSKQWTLSLTCILIPVKVSQQIHHSPSPHTKTSFLQMWFSSTFPYTSVLLQQHCSFQFQYPSLKMKHMP